MRDGAAIARFTSARLLSTSSRAARSRFDDATERLEQLFGQIVLLIHLPPNPGFQHSRSIAGVGKEVNFSLSEGRDSQRAGPRVTGNAQALARPGQRTAAGAGAASAAISRSGGRRSCSPARHRTAIRRRTRRPRLARAHLAFLLDGQQRLEAGELARAEIDIGAAGQGVVGPARAPDRGRSAPAGQQHPAGGSEKRAASSAVSICGGLDLGAAEESAPGPASTGATDAASQIAEKSRAAQTAPPKPGRRRHGWAS